MWWRRPPVVENGLSEQNNNITVAFDRSLQLPGAYGNAVNSVTGQRITGGLVYALYFGQIRYDTGYQIGLIAFTAAVLGGIGNLPGAVLGALLIGFIQAFNEGLVWHAPGSDWTESIVFSILILILVFRPEGLLGERTPEGA